MFCTKCGKEIPENARFCPNCGNQIVANATMPANANNAPKFHGKKKGIIIGTISSTNIWPTVLCYTIGIFFILGGILPYLLQGNLAEYNTYISLLHSPTTISAISCFKQFAVFLSPLFFFSSSVLCIYTGLLLLKKYPKLTVSVITCTIVHIFSIIYSTVVNMLIYNAPKFVLSLYTSEASIIAAGEDIIMSEPDVLYYYQDNAICRLIISIILIALAVIFLFVKKRYINNLTEDNIKSVSPLGGILMIMSVSVLSIISTHLSTFIGRLYGNYTVAANSVANLSFDLSISSIVLFMFIIIIGIAVILTRVKRWILAIPTISTIVVLGVVGCLFSMTIIQDVGTPIIIQMALGILNGLIFNSAVFLIAMFCWFSSVSRGKIPTWLQITLPLLLPLIFTIIEIIDKIVLQRFFGVPLGILGVAFITVITSLLANLNKKRCKSN